MLLHSINNPSTRYYEEKQKKFIIKARERYQNLSEKDEKKR